MLRRLGLVLKKNRLFIIIFLIAVFTSVCIFYTYFGRESFRYPYHDALIFDYPNRFFISKSFNQGQIPLWDHWTNDGMPTSFNISFMNLSPIIYLFSIFGPYSLDTLIFEMFFMQILAFVGMFLWLRTYTNKWIALFGAFCFSLAPPILSTTTDASVICSMSLVPLIAYSCKKTLDKSLVHIGILATSLVIIFTSGYLGMNILYLPIIFSFCFLDFILFKKKDKNMLIGFIYFFIAITLFFGVTSFGWLELWNYTKFNLGYIRDGHNFDPFTGGLRLKVLFSLFYTHNYPKFIPLGAMVPVAGNGYEIYFGVINLAFAVYCFFFKKDILKNLLILFFIIFLFLISLTPEYRIPVYAAKVFPILLLTRWHGWYTILIVFFAVTLAIKGINQLLESKNRKSIKKMLVSLSLVLVTTLAGAGMLIIKSGYGGDFFMLQSICLSLAIIFLYLFGYKNKKSKLRINLIVKILIILSLIEFIPNSFKYITYRDDVFAAKAFQNTKKIFDSSSRTKFNYIDNLRQDSIYQLITGIPSPNGYNSFQMPGVFNLKKSVGEKKYLELSQNIFYFPNQNEYPNKNLFKNIQIKEFKPNNISLIAISSSNNKKLIWSESFTPNWKVFINNHKQEIEVNKYGFTSIKLKGGVNNIYLKYEPPYLKMSKIITILSILLILCLIFSDFIIKANLRFKKTR